MQHQYNPAADPLLKALNATYQIPIPPHSATSDRIGQSAASPPFPMQHPNTPADPQRQAAPGNIGLQTAIHSGTMRGSGNNAAVGPSQSSGAKRPFKGAGDASGINKRHQMEQSGASSVAPQPRPQRPPKPVCTVTFSMWAYLKAFLG